MKRNILIILCVGFVFSLNAKTKTLRYKDFYLGQKKKSVLAILNKKHKNKCVDPNQYDGFKKNCAVVYKGEACVSIWLLLYFGNTSKMHSFQVWFGQMDIVKYQAILDKLEKRYGQNDATATDQEYIGVLEYWFFEKKRFQIIASNHVLDGVVVSFTDKKSEKQYRVESSGIDDF